MKKYLEQLFEHQNLERNQAKEILLKITANEFSEAQIGAFLAAMRMKELAPNEVLGFRDALLETAPAIEINSVRAMDVCGTGGDGKNTFNISTLTAFVLAGAGIPVAKHGNYGSTSVSGSSNVLEHLGIPFSSEVAKLQFQLEKFGLCFIHAPLFHQGMKWVAPVRKVLQVKTFFNVLGPLCNPARPAVQCSGVYHEDIAKLYQKIFQMEGSTSRAIHDLNGYDEASLTAPVKVYGKKVVKVKPQDFGYEPIDPDSISGGDSIDHAAKIFMSVLTGESTKAQTQVVVANAALAIQTYYPEKDLSECMVMAENSLSEKRALNVFHQLKNDL